MLIQDNTSIRGIRVGSVYFWFDKLTFSLCHNWKLHNHCHSKKIYYPFLSPSGQQIGKVCSNYQRPTWYAECNKSTCPKTLDLFVASDRPENLLATFLFYLNRSGNFGDVIFLFVTASNFILCSFYYSLRRPKNPNLSLSIKCPCWTITLHYGR